MSVQILVGQTLDIDSVYQTFSAEIDESKRLKSLNLFLGDPETKGPMVDLQYVQRILVLSLKNKDKIIEAFGIVSDRNGLHFIWKYCKGLRV